MYLGVDGGGTKTAFVILDRSGNILARHAETTSYYFEVGLDGLRSVLRNGVEETLKLASVTADQLDFAFFGIPGYGEDSSLLPTVDAIPAGILKNNNYSCGNDVVCGWAAGTGCKDGIHVVAGTGSITYGENGDVKARVGGWSELFGDEGSAYWIARRALEYFGRMSDGRCTRTHLYQMLIEELNLHNDLDICSLVCSQWHGSRGKIAELSQLVDKAAQLSDPVALQIFQEAAREIALMVKTLKDRLGFDNGQRVVTTYSGGVFNAGKTILDPLRAELHRFCPDCDLTSSEFSPDVGAALYAAKLHGYRFSSESLRELKHHHFTSLS